MSITTKFITVSKPNSNQNKKYENEKLLNKLTCPGFYNWKTELIAACRGNKPITGQLIALPTDKGILVFQPNANDSYYQSDARREIQRDSNGKVIKPNTIEPSWTNVKLISYDSTMGKALEKLIINIADAILEVINCVRSYPDRPDVRELRNLSYSTFNRDIKFLVLSGIYAGLSVPIYMYQYAFPETRATSTVFSVQGYSDNLDTDNFIKNYNDMDTLCTQRSILYNNAEFKFIDSLIRITGSSYSFMSNGSPTTLLMRGENQNVQTKYARIPQMVSLPVKVNRARNLNPVHQKIAQSTLSRSNTLMDNLTAKDVAKIKAKVPNDDLDHELSKVNQPSVNRTIQKPITQRAEITSKVIHENDNISSNNSSANEEEDVNWNDETDVNDVNDITNLEIHELSPPKKNDISSPLIENIDRDQMQVDASNLRNETHVIRRKDQESKNRINLGKAMKAAAQQRHNQM